MIEKRNIIVAKLRFRSVYNIMMLYYKLKFQITEITIALRYENLLIFRRFC